MKIGKLLLAITFIALQLSCKGVSSKDDDSILKGTPCEVHIYDELPDPPLQVHCKSKDDDLHMRTLRTGQSFMWSFHMNFWFSTVFYCHFYWGDKDKSFDVFDYKFENICSTSRRKVVKCMWVVRPDGFFLSNGFDNYTRVHDWVDFEAHNSLVVVDSILRNY